ncbi:hypothetical protein C8R43DRAFT_1228765 [Mycena crocata]|nr:hypothetical protein C8R43DRAFT_1228765 [Mycena crocata]
MKTPTKEFITLSGLYRLLQVRDDMGPDLEISFLDGNVGVGVMEVSTTTARVPLYEFRQKDGHKELSVRKSGSNTSTRRKGRWRFSSPPDYTLSWIPERFLKSGKPEESSVHMKRTLISESVWECTFRGCEGLPVLLTAIDTHREGPSWTHVGNLAALVQNANGKGEPASEEMFADILAHILFTAAMEAGYKSAQDALRERDSLSATRRIEDNQECAVHHVRAEI